MIDCVRPVHRVSRSRCSEGSVGYHYQGARGHPSLYLEHQLARPVGKRLARFPQRGPTKIVRRSVLTPFHMICTPIHKRMNDDKRTTIFMAVSPKMRPIASAKRYTR